MTDQTTAPPAPDTDPTWRRLVMDAAAWQRAYPTPAHLATLVQQAVAAGAAHALSVPLAPYLNDPPTAGQLVAAVLDHAARHPDDTRTAALHAYAHAWQRERHAAKRAAPAAAIENGGNCDG